MSKNRQLLASHKQLKHVPLCSVCIPLSIYTAGADTLQPESARPGQVASWHVRRAQGSPGLTTSLISAGPCVFGYLATITDAMGMRKRGRQNLDRMLGSQV
jgi:hypothetical protein